MWGTERLRRAPFAPPAGRRCRQADEGRGSSLPLGSSLGHTLGSHARTITLKEYPPASTATKQTQWRRR
ncbi:hypothetical protein ELI41_03050 [Rhizobium leguminosarum]|uniref:Uncharacterized protein n=1 Tax=Rhizobium leguminosarum TaxID=384 RepID=A0ABD7PMA6_RHILE|nr:hypothetical protein ELI41_03050 [Rhizobium leguminosarum]TAW28532.1 hypothetical protein ELI19_02990 [Rhizobium leguminosarum]TAW42266.1 hypothetical protein ELI18_02985 [Rhizobium leguminosarum]TAY31647.1 hypothetical protein ELH93_02975 [Rhizobium leguminosarum]